MNSTPFPARPSDVVALSAQEFAFSVEMSDTPPFELVCNQFADDSNRALVWLIRFRALKAWCARPDMLTWMSAGSRTSRDLCEVAASFELNDRWEFDADDFRAAIDWMIAQRRPGQ
jgi:hypothetical protein